MTDIMITLITRKQHCCLQLQTYLVIISSPKTHKDELVTNLILEKRA